MGEAILHQRKENALNLLRTLEMPSLKYGQGMFLNLDLDFYDFSTALQHDNPETITITADPSVKVTSLTEMDDHFVKTYAEKLVPAGEDKFTALHYASVQKTHVIIIPKNTSVDKPIFIHSSLKAKAKAENIIVVAEEGAAATIIEIAASSLENTYKSQIVQVYAKQNAHLTYSTLHNLTEHSYSFITKRGEANQDASITWIDFLLGGKFTRLQLRTNLVSPGAATKKWTVFYGSQEQLFDIKTETFHRAPHTEGIMKAKGILNNQAKTIYRGTINIDKHSTNSIGHQRADTILLGEEAKCDAVPVLEVENDDVTCSHGVAIGQFNEEQLFYLLSRGLDEDNAQKMIIQGFFDPIIGQVPDEETQNVIKDVLSQKVCQ